MEGLPLSYNISPLEYILQKYSNKDNCNDVELKQ